MERSGSDLLARLLAETLDNGVGVLDSLSPPFIAVFHDGRSAETHVQLDRIGIQHLYAYEHSDGTTWLSSSLWPLLRVAPPILEPRAIVEWLAFGHFISQATFFERVTKVPGGRHVVMADDQARVVRERWTPNPEMSTSTTVGAGGEYASEFSASLDASYPAHGAVAEVTGGLDTRLVLAARLASGRSLRGWTLGNPEGPDIRTVRALQERVPFEHMVAEVGDQLRDDVFGLVAEMHDLSDGEVNALEYAPLLAAFHQLEGKRDVSVTGSGGETARGFYFSTLAFPGKRVRGIPVGGLMQKLTRVPRNLQLQLRGEVRDRFGDGATEAAREFIIASPCTAAEGILEDLYLRGRMQRFAGRNITTTGLFCGQGLPFFGNELLETTLALPFDAKRDGRVVREAIVELSPALAEVPLDSGVAVYPMSWRRPVTYARRAISLGHKVVNRYGGRVGFHPSPGHEDVPWARVRGASEFADYCRDLLTTRDSRSDLFFDRSVKAALVSDALEAKTSLYPLGLLLTLELTLRRTGADLR